MAKRRINHDTRVAVTIQGEKITAPAHILNLICMMASEAAENYRRDGSYCWHDEMRDIQKEVHEQLRERGYYD